MKRCSRVYSALTWPKKSLKHLNEAELKGKKVLVRVDLNVPLSNNYSEIADDSKIRACVATIHHLMRAGAKIIVASHFGFPNGREEIYSFKTLLPVLSVLWGYDVQLASDCVGQDVAQLVENIPEGGILLLENLRFHHAEYRAGEDFAKQLASLADVYVNEALGISHLSHASTDLVPQHLQPRVAGLQMHKELQLLFSGLADQKKPFAAIVGGYKLSAKIGLIESLLEKVNVLLLGGGLIYTFYKAHGHPVGSSLVEDSMLDMARLIKHKAEQNGVKLYIAEDAVVGEQFGAHVPSKVVEGTQIPTRVVGLDIGPNAIKKINKELDEAETIFWNGPMGVCEYEKFSVGTKAVATKLVECSGKDKTTIVLGDDTITALAKMKLADEMTHLLHGGSAWLQVLAGKLLPAVVRLEDSFSTIHFLH